jgi:hypothetical protein
MASFGCWGLTKQRNALGCWGSIPCAARAERSALRASLRRLSEGVRRFSVADCEGLRPSLCVMCLRPLILPSPGGWLPHVFKVVDSRTNVKKMRKFYCLPYSVIFEPATHPVSLPTSTSTVTLLILTVCNHNMDENPASVPAVESGILKFPSHDLKAILFV